MSGNGSSSTHTNLGDIHIAGGVTTNRPDPRRMRTIILLLAGSVALMMTGFGIIMPVFARRLAELGSGVEALGIMTTAFARVGLAGDYGGTWFLTHLVGPAKAKELYFMPERMDMATALDLGIVNTVAGADEFDEVWRGTAARLAAGPPIAYRYMKENINRSIVGDLNTPLELEATHHRHSGTTRDHMEASKAFVEKREPEFEGR